MGAKLHKACGSDQLFAEVFRNAGTIDILYSFFSVYFEYSTIPDRWQEGIINPIYKNGDKFNPQNYRGITLQNVSCKMYTDILNKRLMAWLEAENLLCDEQNGFRPKRSCLDHIYVLNSIISTSIANKKEVYGCFVDFRKAFDRVNRDCLWYKLLLAGVKGKMYFAIKSLYENVKCCVKIGQGGIFTDSFSASQGLKQGCKISPTLFCLYINELASKLNQLRKGITVGDQHVPLLMYADDIVLLANSDVDLQAQLDCLNSWCYKWRLELNQEKTKVVHFRKKSAVVTDFDFLCGNIGIKKAENYKYLGLWFNEHMDMTYAAREIAKSATRALGSLIVKFKELGGISYDCFQKMYESSVEPILLYGAGVWGTREYKIINTVQNKACRFLLGVQKTAANLATRGDLGWTSLLCKQRLEVVRLWTRLKIMHDTRLTAKVFKYNYRQAVVFRKKNWEFKVQNMFNGINLGFLVDVNEEINVRRIIEQCKTILFEGDEESWYHKLWDDVNHENGNKLRTYRSFKYNLQVENYVKINLPWFKKRYFAMLRAGCLPLEIEKGRQQKPKVPVEARKCKLCMQNCIEDEFHFIMNCSLYADLRDDLFEHFTRVHVGFSGLSDLDKFCYIMYTGDYKTCKTVFNMYLRRSLFV